MLLKMNSRTKKAYPVILTTTSENVLVEIPDLNIFTQGEDIADAMEMARDAIGLYIVTSEDNEEIIKDSSKINEIDVSKGKFINDGESIITLVDIDIVEYRNLHDNKTVRRNVTIPNWLNVKADKANLNVSKLLQEALKEKLQEYR